MSTLPDHVRLDSISLKVLAHPLRSRMLSELRLGGPATATDLARELGTNTGATSYHLRQLARVGLVVDTGDGDRKRRVWAASATETLLDPSDVAGDADAETALGWLAHDWLRHFTEKFGRWLDAQVTWPVAWRDAAGMSDYAVLVTAEQMGELSAQLDALISRYARVGAGNPDAKRVAVYTASYPIDLDRTPRR